jgi:hypothetical protein
MSPAGKAEIPTPLLRLQRKKRATRIFTALLVMLVALLTGTVLAVNDGRNYHRLIVRLGLADIRLFGSPPPMPADDQRYQRITAVPAYPARLLAPSVQRATELDRPRRARTAHERCGELGVTGASPSTFQASGGEWECVFSREMGDGPEPSILFVQAKGTSPTSFRTFRAKLSLLDPNEDEGLIRATLDAMDGFGLALSPESRSYVEEKLSMRRGFSSLLEDHRISFEQEREDERRFNLLITPRQPMADCASPVAHVPGSRLRSTTTAEPVGCLRFPNQRHLPMLGPIEAN